MEQPTDPITEERHAGRGGIKRKVQSKLKPIVQSKAHAQSPTIQRQVFQIDMQRNL